MNHSLQSCLAESSQKPREEEEEEVEEGDRGRRRKMSGRRESRKPYSSFHCEYASFSTLGSEARQGSVVLLG